MEIFFFLVVSTFSLKTYNFLPYYIAAASNSDTVDEAGGSVAINFNSYTPVAKNSLVYARGVAIGKVTANCKAPSLQAMLASREKGVSKRCNVTIAMNNAANKVAPGTVAITVFPFSSQKKGTANNGGSNAHIELLIPKTTQADNKTNAVPGYLSWEQFWRADS